MARAGDTCVSIGNADWFRGDSVSTDPVSVLPAELLRSTVGNAVNVSGDSSYSEDELDTLYYDWDVQGPPGYEEVTYTDDQESIRLDPNVVGEYIVTLSVVGASGGCSNTATLGVYAFSSASPHHEGTALDASYLWELLPTAWSKVERDPRLKIELYWRGLKQLLSSSLLDAMTTDMSKAVLAMSAHSAKRHIDIPLTHSIADEGIYISPSNLEIEASPLTRYTLSFGQSTVTPRATYSFSARVLSENTLEVRSTDQFQPYAFDENAEISVPTLTGRATTRVASVVKVSLTKSVYTLTSPIAQVDQIGAVLDVTLTPAYGSPESVALFDRDGVYKLLRYRPSGGVGQYRVSAGFLEVDDVPLRLQQSITLKYAGAWRKGVRPGDTARFTVNEAFSGTSVDVDLEVAEILHESGVDSIALVPVEGLTLSELLEIACEALLPQVSNLPHQLRVYLNNIFLPRSAGFTLTDGFTVSLIVDAQPVTLSVHFVDITLASAAFVAPEVRELSVLREFIEVHEEDPSGEYIITEAERALFLGRRQLSLLENRDFTVIASGEQRIDLAYSQGDAFLTAFEDVSSFVGIGDYVADPRSTLGEIHVVSKVEGNRLFVAPLPASERSARPYALYSADGRGLVSFERGALPYPSPSKLWAEAATVENIEALEARLGQVTGLSYRDWQALGTRSSYLSTLKAMFIGYVQGPTLSNLESAANSVLGAPYTDARMLILDITYNFRAIDEVEYAKVIAEIVDDDDQGVGLLQDFLVPTKAKYAAPGAISEDLPFSVGDILEAGVSLSSAIRVVDHALRPHDLMSRHSFDVRVASGSTPLGVNAVRLLADYVSSIKPAHTDFSIKPVHYVRDEERIDSSIDLKVIKQLFETPYGLHGPAEVLDDYIPGIGKHDSRPFMVLSTWFPNDAHFTSEGDVHTLDSATGGFLLPLEQYTLTHPSGAVSYIQCQYDAGEWIKPGDAVVLPLVEDAPIALITEVVNDGTLRLDRGDLSLYNERHFAVVRFIDDLLLHDSIQSASNAPNINVIELGARASNVSRGDVVSFNTAVDAPRPIIRMSGTRAVLATSGYRRLTGAALDVGSEIKITRPRLRPIECGEITLNIEHVSDALYTGSIVSRDSADIAGVRIGDLLDGFAEVIAIDRDRTKVYIDSGGASVAEGERAFRIENPHGIEGADSLDLADRGVDSSIMLSLKLEGILRVGDTSQLRVLDTHQVRRYLDEIQESGYALRAGDIVKLTSVEIPARPLLNVGEGQGVYRLVRWYANNGGYDLVLNVDLTEMSEPSRVAITLIKQGRTRSIHLR